MARPVVPKNYVCLDGSQYTFKFKLGQIVYHRAMEGKKKGIVNGYLVNPNGFIVYRVEWSLAGTDYYSEHVLTTEFTRDWEADEDEDELMEEFEDLDD